MAKTRVFTSFDYDNNAGLRILLVGQAALEDSPFSLADWSVREHMTGDWREKVKARMRNVDVVCIICGERTHLATGVTAEIAIAQELMKPYFLLKGYKDKNCVWPAGSKPTDKMYDWTWPNLKILIGGGR